MLNKFKAFAKEQKEGFCSYEWSNRIVRRGKQTFAIFGSIAYDVSKQKFDVIGEPRGTGKLCVPVGGRYFAEFPDEGQSGIMGMYILDRKGKKIVTAPSFVPCGWLYISELGLSNKEIKENIFNDMAEGKNVYWPAPAGWDL